MQKLLPYLKLAVEKNASDIFFTCNAPAMLKVEGDMLAVGKNLMTSEVIRELVQSILTAEQQEYLEQEPGDRPGDAGRRAGPLSRQHLQSARLAGHGDALRQVRSPGAGAT